MVAQAELPVEFDFVPRLPVVVRRHAGQMSSDAGLLPLRQPDERPGYTRRMADCPGGGGAGREHPLPSMLRQRLFGVLAGYEDCNDHDTLRGDPVLKLVAGRLPDEGPLASQPTLSRFENGVTPAVPEALIDLQTALGVERLKERHGGRLPAALTPDLDATDDPTRGGQQLALFHGYHGQYQYYPLVISEPGTRHVFLTRLRHGTAHAARGADDDLMRVVAALRKERPDVVTHVRGDAGYGVPHMYAACEGGGLFYTFGFSPNPRLKRMTGPLMARAAEQSARTGEKARLFECLSCRRGDWPHARDVVAKGGCHRGGTNLRFVVTNLPATCPLRRPPARPAPARPAPAPAPGVTTAAEGEAVYDGYILRGESEHRMDEPKNGLHAGRLSCHRFMANFFRLLPHAAAYNLLNAARDDAGVPEALRAGQPCTWRTRLIKVAAEVVRTTRRVLVRVAARWPRWPDYRAVSARAAARPAAVAPPPSPLRRRPAGPTPGRPRALLVNQPETRPRQWG